MYPPHFGNNPLFPNKKDFGVVVKNQASGMGVMTYKFIAKGSLVCAIAGDIITEIRQHTLQIEPELHLHDIYFSGYLLHSCSPNVELDMKKLLVYAVKDIAAMEYLTMDYAQTEDILYKQFPCGCGAENCRGWITGRKELPVADAVLRNGFRLPDNPFDECQNV
jgi:uncharacterized protein